jgi:hypothetical protein
MVNQNHPITPPPVLVEKWYCHSLFDRGLILATWAAQWGADQELDACCEWNSWRYSKTIADQLRVARRPKPPSLKEQALTALHAVATGANDTREQHQDLDTIRQALEALDD